MSDAMAIPSVHDLKSYDMLITSSVFLALSAITVVGRIYVRGWMIRFVTFSRSFRINIYANLLSQSSFGWDDWLMMATWVSAFACAWYPCSSSDCVQVLFAAYSALLVVVALAEINPPGIANPTTVGVILSVCIFLTPQPLVHA